MSSARRSWLYVSGARPEHFSKALATSADRVIFDLEDSVPAGAKAAARLKVVGFLTTHASSRTLVRTNPPTTREGRDDLSAIAALPIGGVRLPKIEAAADVRAATGVLGRPEVAVQPTVESARGLQALDEIAAEEAVQQICLGEADLAADLGMTSRDWLQPIRIDVVVRSRAAGLFGPLLSPHTHLRDLDGLAETTRQARSMGFAGRSAIHPAQVEVINSVYVPDDDEVAKAQEVLRALAVGDADGRAGVQLPDGRFVDLSGIAAARRIVEQHNHHSTKGGAT